MTGVPEDPYALLGEWLAWWARFDAAPAKLPNALQVRTAVALTLEHHERGTTPDLGALLDAITAMEFDGG